MLDPTHTPIIRRRVNIDFDSAKRVGWHSSSQEEKLLNALSFVFPAGEKYFIASVQHYMDRITDPVLKEQAKRFIYQEAMHTKEHIRTNEVLKEAHSHGGEMEKIAERVLAVCRLLQPKATQLATTCALEHFTAMLAHNLLKNQQHFISVVDPAFAALWLWHAVEEAEHKAVCFDVYQHIFGKGVFSYLHRVIVMFFASMGFLIFMGAGFTLMKWRERGKQDTRSDAAANDAPANGVSAGAPSVSVMVKDVSWRLYFDYYRPSFHPWNDNNTDMIEEWKQRYAGFGAGPDAAMSEAKA
jgi:predicted metal-dependent hydrolase